MEAEAFRERWTVPEHLHILPYVEEFGEYAAVVRQEIVRRRGTDFILAVDLPAGLEEAVLDAVQRLPRPSVVALPDRRAIPVLPSSAPVEAVRSFLEYGLDLVFIDTPVPALGSVEDYRDFVNACSHFGCPTVYHQLIQFGYSLPTGDAIRESETSPHDLFELFAHLPASVDRRVMLGSFASLPLSMQTRAQFMAYRLRPLLARGIEVVLVCSAGLVAGVVECLGRDLPWFPDDLRVPTETFRLAEKELPAVTLEIPYFIWLYEVNRDQEADRHAWVEQVYRESIPGHDVPARRLIQAVQFADRLALTGGQVAPWLRDLVTSARCVVDASYARDVLNRALTYPPAYDPEEFPPLPPMRNMQTGADLGAAAETAELESAFNPGDGEQATERVPVPRWVPFYRNQESRENEVVFIQYMTSHFTATRPSPSETETREFTSGFGEGLDLREMLRNGDPSTVYVREAVREHAASFVLDLREACLARVQAVAGPDADVHAAFLSSAIHVTVESGYPAVGICYDEEVRLTPYVLATLPTATRPLRELALKVVKRRPLSSAVAVALDQSPFVFVFTDHSDEFIVDEADRRRLRILPLDTIPQAHLQRMLGFCQGGRSVDADAG